MQFQHLLHPTGKNTFWARFSVVEPSPKAGAGGNYRQKEHEEGLRKQNPQRVPSPLCFPDKATEELFGKQAQGSPAGQSSAPQGGHPARVAQPAPLSHPGGAEQPEKAGGLGG